MELINKQVEWIAVDWGTTNLRAWGIGTNGKVVCNPVSDQGMGVLDRDGFEPALLDLVSTLLLPDRITPVVACGMVGSRQGWTEARYVTAPCAPPGYAQSVVAPTSDPRLSVRILPGVKQTEPADVMRGEETQVAGFLQQHKDFNGVVCLPGTHTKWVHISSEKIISFQTFLTGELFSLLSKQSVLRHSISKTGWDESTFLTAVSEATSDIAAVPAEFFSIRAQSLIGELQPASARARLSGLLIGLELAAARPYWQNGNVVIIGEQYIAGLYKSALEAQGHQAVIANAADMTLSGLATAYNDLKEASQ
jgi:2-dehydro-3-deoxygalactonokinase